MRDRTCFRRTNDNSFRCGGLGRSRWMLVSTIGCSFFLDNIIAASFFTSSLTFFYFAIACFIFWTILLYFSMNSSSASRILYTNSCLKDFCRMEVVFADIGVLCFVKELARFAPEIVDVDSVNTMFSWRVFALFCNTSDRSFSSIPLLKSYSSQFWWARVRSSSLNAFIQIQAIGNICISVSIVVCRIALSLSPMDRYSLE